MPSSPRPASARVTVAEIAASAGVSVATVSKVLNQRSDVAPETRARVKALLAEQHYVCLLYTSPSPRDATLSRMPSSA